MTDEVKVGGLAFESMLGDIDVEKQIKDLQKEYQSTKSKSKKDGIVKRLKYLAGLRKLGIKPEHAFILRHMPVVPPIVRPPVQTGGNRIEFADVNYLYRDHMSVNNNLKELGHTLEPHALVPERKALYDGAKAIFGLGDAISGYARGKDLNGFIAQIAGKYGPKGGYFQSKLLSRKQDFSGRATIRAEANLGFNEVAVPKDMLWTLYEYHIMRDLVQQGFDLIRAKKEIESRGPAAVNSFNKLIKQIPVILNRAPTLMRTNVTAHYPVPVEGKTLGINPLHLALYSGDFDGDALSIHTPMTPEAINEAREKLLPEAHAYDYRKGIGISMMAPGHEAIVGSSYLTEPDSEQKPVTFKTELDALKALKNGHIKENTPLIIEEHAKL